jgi:hypothetical protein
MGEECFDREKRTPSSSVGLTTAGTGGDEIIMQYDGKISDMRTVAFRRDSYFASRY